MMLWRRQTLFLKGNWKEEEERKRQQAIKQAKLEKEKQELILANQRQGMLKEKVQEVSFKTANCCDSIDRSIHSRQN